MMAEDEVLYPALMRALPASMGSVEPLHDEHGELRLMLERLCATFSEPPGKARDEQVAVQVHDLADLLRIHLRKEESLVFGVAARLLSADVIESVMTRMTTAAPSNRPATDLTRTKGTSQ
jgi:hemerythrin-like domain-containing protein